jgi:hypothetical protein
MRLITIGVGASWRASTTTAAKTRQFQAQTVKRSWPTGSPHDIWPPWNVHASPLAARCAENAQHPASPALDPGRHAGSADSGKNLSETANKASASPATPAPASRPSSAGGRARPPPGTADDVVTLSGPNVTPQASTGGDGGHHPRQAPRPAAPSSTSTSTWTPASSAPGPDVYRGRGRRRRPPVGAVQAHVHRLLAARLRTPGVIAPNPTQIHPAAPWARPDGRVAVQPVRATDHPAATRGRPNLLQLPGPARPDGHQRDPACLASGCRERKAVRMTCIDACQYAC